MKKTTKRFSSNCNLLLLIPFATLCIKNIKFFRLVLSGGGGVKMFKRTKLYCLFGVFQINIGTMDSFKNRKNNT